MENEGERDTKLPAWKRALLSSHYHANSGDITRAGAKPPMLTFATWTARRHRVPRTWGRSGPGRCEPLGASTWGVSPPEKIGPLERRAARRILRALTTEPRS